MINEARMVIVGAGVAGTAAALSLRERGWRGALVLVGNEAMLPYERPPLSKANLIEAIEPGPKFIIMRDRLNELGIEYLHDREVVAIERAAHSVRLSNGARLTYERLLLATGAHARNLSNPDQRRKPDSDASFLWRCSVYQADIWPRLQSSDRRRRLNWP